VCATAAYVPTVAPGNGAILNLTPAAIGGAASNISDDYVSYRITKVQVKVFPIPLASAGYTVVAVSVNVSDALATGFSPGNLLVMNHHKMIVTGVSTPQVFNVPRSYLVGANAVKAVKSVPGAPADWDEIYAQLFVATTSTSFAVTMEVRVWFEFEGLVPTVLTPSPSHVQRDVSLMMVVAEMTKYNRLHTDSHMEPKFDKATGIFFSVIKPGSFHLKSLGAVPAIVPLIPEIVPVVADPAAAQLLV